MHIFRETSLPSGYSTGHRECRDDQKREAPFISSYSLGRTTYFPCTQTRWLNEKIESIIICSFWGPLCLFLHSSVGLRIFDGTICTQYLNKENFFINSLRQLVLWHYFSLFYFSTFFSYHSRKYQIYRAYSH